MQVFIASLVVCHVSAFNSAKMEITGAGLEKGDSEFTLIAQSLSQATLLGFSVTC
jgi:hypothetical protein